jgi:hypothetical protein
VLRGPQPEFRGYGSWQEELEGILRQLREWAGGNASTAVSVPTNKQVEQVESYLSAHGVPAGSIGPDGVRGMGSLWEGSDQRVNRPRAPAGATLECRKYSVSTCRHVPGLERLPRSR